MRSLPLGLLGLALKAHRFDVLLIHLILHFDDLLLKLADLLLEFVSFFVFFKLFGLELF